MSYKLGLILDVAHGSDTPGKRSPDGKHLEWVWSRNILKQIYSKLVEQTDINVHCPFLSYTEEPGLTKRVRAYNEISKAYDKTFMISLHNDAYGEGWTSPRGISFWTSRGETGADKLATSLFKFIEKELPNEKLRTAFWLNKGESKKDIDYEANFTVLAGNSSVIPKYDGVLIEWKFQSNKEDVADLMDDNKNIEVVNTLFKAIKSLL